MYCTLLRSFSDYIYIQTILTINVKYTQKHLLGESASRSLSSCDGDFTDPGDIFTGACGDGIGPDPALPALLAGPAFALCDVVIVISPLDAASLCNISIMTSLSSKCILIGWLKYLMLEITVLHTDNLFKHVFVRSVVIVVSKSC